MNNSLVASFASEFVPQIQEIVDHDVQIEGMRQVRGDLVFSTEEWHCLQCGMYYFASVPWFGLGRREGAWGNANRVLRRSDKSIKPTTENKSAGGVASVYRG